MIQGVCPMPNSSLFARLFIVILVVAAAFATAPAQAQPWSGIIDPSRAIDWSTAGVPGGIPTNRTQCGSTIAPTNNAAIINNALAACGANQFVKLGAGTFNLSAGVNVTNNNVTLRGSGPDQTILKFSVVTGCIGWAGELGLGACNNNEWLGIQDEVLDGVSWTTPWTGGYAKGTTKLTVGSTANMAAGRLIWLDQLGETTDDGGLVSSGYYPTFRGYNGPTAVSMFNRCDTADGEPIPRDYQHCRTLQQIVRIVSVDSPTQITITPGLEMPNWRSAMKPAVSGWGRTDNSSAFGIGLEDLTVENLVAINDHTIILVGDCYGCWIKNVRSINGKRAHVQIMQSAHTEIRDSYFYGSITSNSQSYGVEHFGASDSLIINNISESTTAAYVGACSGCVVAYNYNFGSFYTDGRGCIDPTNTRNSTCNYWAHFVNHDTGGGMYLLEGNQHNGMRADAWFHGGSGATTAFRNAWRGNDDQGGKTVNQIAIVIDAAQRANNFVGNLLGDPTVSMVYEVPFGSSYEWTSQAAIYQFGAGGSPMPNDPIVASSSLRWGNYDTAHGSVQWNASEVPTTGIRSVNGNPVPANHNLPNSFFLAAAPTSWWATPWGTPPWPPIGPDVTGGNPALAGHVYDIPSKLCFTHLSNDPAYGSSTPPVKLFNATNCYRSSGSSVTTAPIVTLTIQ